MTDKASVEKSADAFRTISEVADELNVPQHVLRFWETRFAQIKPLKRGGGRRFYRPDDVDLIRGIRHLLYGEGYTIRGVQRILKEEGVRFVQAAWREGWSPPEGANAQASEDDLEPDHVRDVAADPPAAERRPVALSAATPRREPYFMSGTEDQRTSERGGMGQAETELHPPARHPPVAPLQRSAAPAQPGLESLWSAESARAAGAGPPAPPRGEHVLAQAESPARPAHRLSPDGRRRLEEALAELIECRRLLAAARSGGSETAD